MIDHIGYAVKDFAKSRHFYERALAPLGITLQMEVTAEQTGAGAHAGFGSDGRAYFWIGDQGRVGGSTHIAFAADSRAKVDAFYKAALGAGGKDNGAPGPRPHYHENYYGAFVLDPDGNNIEAVCHKP
jgi:catechol 2,3-dioxygenase-like lactoylglutathione lyase family enzyme